MIQGTFSNITLYLYYILVYTLRGFDWTHLVSLVPSFPFFSVHYCISEFFSTCHKSWEMARMCYFYICVSLFWRFKKFLKANYIIFANCIFCDEKLITKKR